MLSISQFFKDVFYRDALPWRQEIHNAMDSEDSEGNTLLHLAIKQGSLEKLPREFLTVENLLKKNRRGESCAELCCKFSLFEKLPPSIFCEELLTSKHGCESKSFLQLIIKSGFLTNLEKTLLNARTLSTEDAFGNSPLHDAAYYKVLGDIPANELHSKSLLKFNRRNQTPAHFAAKSGELSKIPNAEITLQLFKARTHSGNSVAHWAAKYGSLDQIPCHLIPELLTVRNAHGQTVAHFAAWFGSIASIPEEHLSKKILLRKNNKKNTVLAWAAFSRNLHKIPHGVLSSECLKSFKKKFPRVAPEYLGRQIAEEEKKEELMRHLKNSQFPSL
jgi:ankyrin repeat protein